MQRSSARSGSGPAHEWDGWRAAKPMKNLYVGAAGVFVALDELRRRGHAETRLDLAKLARGNVDLFRERPDYMKGEEQLELRASSLLCGEAGILLVAWRLAPRRRARRRPPSRSSTRTPRTTRTR